MKNTNKTHKIALRATATKNFKNFANQQHKSLSACIRTVRDVCMLNTFSCEEDEVLVKQFRSLLRKDDIKVADITPKWLVDRLNDTKFCKNGVLGHTKKNADGTEEFVPYDTWTPGRVVDFVRRASNASWKAYNAAIREARKSTLSK